MGRFRRRKKKNDKNDKNDKKKLTTKQKGLAALGVGIGGLTIAGMLGIEEEDLEKIPILGDIYGFLGDIPETTKIIIFIVIIIIVLVLFFKLKSFLFGK